MEQNKKTEIHLYCGFRKATETVLGMKICYWNDSETATKSFHLHGEEKPYYVMDLIKRDADVLIDMLTQGGVVNMICGSLAKGCRSCS
jgi:sulfite reductase (NADPH) flavoprotein alpha-component